MTASWTYYGAEDNSTVLYGTKGILRIYDDPAYSLKLITAGGEKVLYELEAIQTNDNQTASGVIDCFMDCLTGNTPPPSPESRCSPPCGPCLPVWSPPGQAGRCPSPRINERSFHNMKLGFVSAILDGWSFEEMIDTARDLGFSCVEAACWPSGKAERRYAGVSHIDVDGLTDEKSAYILGYCKERGVELSSLAFYPNTMDEDLEKRAANIAHLKRSSWPARSWAWVWSPPSWAGPPTRPWRKTWSCSGRSGPPSSPLPRSTTSRWPSRTAPCGSTPPTGPAARTSSPPPTSGAGALKSSPAPASASTTIPATSSGSRWTTSAPVRVQGPHLPRPLQGHQALPREAGPGGRHGLPLQYMEPKLPGLGDVNWAKYVSALTDIGYSGYTCIEVEDRAFEGSRERILDSLRLSKRYLEQFVI